MNSGVPSTMPVAVSFTTSGPARRSLARPKSITTARNPLGAVGVRHQHDVLGLEIPMDDLELMGVAETVANLDQERNPLRHGKGTPASLMLAERLAFEVGHDQIEQPVGGLAQAKDGADVGMVEPGGDGGFPPEPLDRRRVSGQPGDQDLDGDRSAGVDLLGLIDVRHPAFAQLPVDLVALVEDLSGETRQAGRYMAVGRLERSAESHRGIAGSGRPAGAVRLGSALDQQRSVLDAESGGSVVCGLTARAAPVTQSRNRLRPSLLAR